MKIFLLVNLLSFPFFATAQNETGDRHLDSLVGELAKIPEDTNKVLLLDEISYAYVFINPDNGIKYATQAKELSERLGWKRGLALAYADLGEIIMQSQTQRRSLFISIHPGCIRKSAGKAAWRLLSPI